MPTEVSNPTTFSPARKQEAQDPVFLRIRDLVYHTCGIYHSDEKLYLLTAACQRRMATSAKPSDAKFYLQLLTGAASKDWETRELLNEITIGETCLFRSKAQINALKNVILPELLLERARTGVKKLKIWSAGCSTGEEPHTLSILFLEEQEKLPRDWNFEIHATDLNDRSIAAARAGIYGDYALRNTPEIYKRKYFTELENGKLKVKDEVKARITFTRLNLTDNGGMGAMKGMDMIFCCNVLIYFDAASKKRVVAHYFSNL